MQRIRITGLSIVVVVAMSLVAAAAATAEELPEVGRCQRLSSEKVGHKKVYHGGYKNSSCTKVSVAKEGKYEWLPGPGPLNKITSKEGRVTSKTVGGGGVFTCPGGSDTGEYLGAKTETASSTDTGCELEAASQRVKCQNTGATAGTVKTNPLEGELGFIKGGTKPSVGIDLKPTSLSAPYTVAYECGGVEILEEGSIIAPIAPIDRMSSTFTLTYKELNGRQIPEEFENGLPDILITIVPSRDVKEQGGVETTTTETSEEPLEVKAKV